MPQLGLPTGVATAGTLLLLYHGVETAPQPAGLQYQAGDELPDARLQNVGPDAPDLRLASGRVAVPEPGAGVVEVPPARLGVEDARPAHPSPAVSAVEHAAREVEDAPPGGRRGAVVLYGVPRRIH